jgi:hypothetical protein
VVRCLPLPRRNYRVHGCQLRNQSVPKVASCFAIWNDVWVCDFPQPELAAPCPTRTDPTEGVALALVVVVVVVVMAVNPYQLATLFERDAKVVLQLNDDVLFCLRDYLKRQWEMDFGFEGL